jgi:lipopolysaccharide export system protein LptA
MRVDGSVQRKAAEQEPKIQTALETAVQDGNVVLTDTPAKKSGSNTPPATLTGWAHHAEYHAASQVLHLTGSPRITDGESMEMAADAIDYQRDTQNMAAAGHVKATYTQQQPGAGTNRSAPPPSMGGNGPVHVIAERAAMDHATNEALFYGTLHAPARMWQDADSLLAPVIEIDRIHNVLKAWGENTGTQPVVDANFTLAMGTNRQLSVMRVHSQTLVYSEQTRQADFHGSVAAEQGKGTIHADNALMALKPAAASPGAGQHAGTAANAKAARAAAAPSKQGSPGQLDRLVATGHVVLRQPGRRGEGEKLVYTANDGKYVLTGTPEARPKMWDRMRGTTTGAALIFNSQDDRIEVNGGQSSAVTETRVPK